MSRHFDFVATGSKKRVIYPVNRLIRVLASGDVRFYFDDPTGDKGYTHAVVNVNVSELSAFLVWISEQLSPTLNTPIVIDQKCKGVRSVDP